MRKKLENYLTGHGVEKTPQNSAEVFDVFDVFDRHQLSAE